MVENVLPKSYSYRILRSSLTSNERFQCDVRAKIGSLEEFSIWLNDFENITNTCWIVRDSVSSEKSRFLISKNYVCQHSAYRKKKDASKNKNCLASLLVRIKRNTKFIRCRDPLAKDGYRALIKINFIHSHELNKPELWNYLPKSDETKEIFWDLFDCGMSPTAARTYHRSLLLAECPEYMSNGRLNPPAQWVHNLYEKWLKKNSGNHNIKLQYKNSSLTQSEVLRNELEQFASQIGDDDFSAVIKYESDDLFNTSVSLSSKENRELERTPKQNQPKRMRSNSDSDSFRETKTTNEESHSMEKTSNEIFGELVASYLDKLSTENKQSDTRIKITKMLLEELIIDC